ncbi:MAG: type II toxin-antitoxin system PemK/MazF family toxin [Rhodovibrionaceae bacterium]|nr:type II toxin-antitoxin system PemK/MazF family toxin [Rhodovibrionaceae bacterium]
MALPDPEPGLVVCYEYLWHRQQTLGATEAEKARPAVIVLISAETQQVMVAAITTQEDDRDSIGIPPRVAAHLGLDNTRPSRVVVDEVNYFHWPNDLAQVPNAPRSRFHYGFLPPRLFETIKQAIVRNHSADNLAKVKRQP